MVPLKDCTFHAHNATLSQLAKGSVQVRFTKPAFFCHVKFFLEAQNEESVDLLLVAIDFCLRRPWKHSLKLSRRPGERPGRRSSGVSAPGLVKKHGWMGVRPLLQASVRDVMIIMMPRSLPSIERQGPVL